MGDGDGFDNSIQSLRACWLDGFRWAIVGLPGCVRTPVKPESETQRIAFESGYVAGERALVVAHDDAQCHAQFNHGAQPPRMVGPVRTLCGSPIETIGLAQDGS